MNRPNHTTGNGLARFAYSIVWRWYVFPSSNAARTRANATNKRPCRWRACTTTDTGCNSAARTRDSRRPKSQHAFSSGHSRGGICDDVLQSAVAGAVVAPGDGRWSAWRGHDSTCDWHAFVTGESARFVAAQSRRLGSARPASFLQWCWAEASLLRLGAKPPAAAQHSWGLDARPRWQHQHTNCTTATALALAMMLAFAPMGDAQAAVGDCYGVRYDGLCYGVGSIEVSKEHISSSAPTRRVQVQGPNLAAGDGRRRPTISDIFETEEDVKALQARVATIEKQVPKVRVPLALPAPAFAVFLVCNVAGGALLGALFAAFGFELTPSIGLLAFVLYILLPPDQGFQRNIGVWCFSTAYPTLSALIRFVKGLG